MSYCTTCGAENVKEWTGKFDAKTGEKEMREVCGRVACHSGCLNEYTTGFPWPWKPNTICTRCGRHGWFGD